MFYNTDFLCSATGRNVANIQEEFRVDPLKCDPGNIIVQIRAIPENSFLDIELLETLLNIRDAEQEPDKDLKESNISQWYSKIKRLCSYDQHKSDSVIVESKKNKYEPLQNEDIKVPKFDMTSIPKVL